MYLSLIVPVYNGGHLIEKCLNSILKQTFNDYEVIIIDDGSKDDTLQVCRRFSAMDSRFHVYHKENEGLSRARNDGLSKASGDYICWADHDDYMEPDYLQSLVDSCEKYAYPDCVFHGLLVKNNDDSTPKLPCKNEGLYRLPDDVDQFFHNVNVKDFGFSFGKLFKRSIIEENHLVYNPKIVLGEDLDFFVRFLSVCKEIAVFPLSTYYYCVWNTSISHRIYEFDAEIGGLDELVTSWTQMYSSIGNGKKIVWSQLFESIQSIFGRTLFSNYKNRYDKKVRITNLKKFSSSVVSIGNTNYTSIPFLSFISWCLKHHFFAFADTVCKVRYNIRNIL